MRPGSGDAAISDITGTLLMVAAVVLAGGALMVVVSNDLAQPGVPSVALALAPVAPGDPTLAVSLRHGDTLPLAGILLQLSRNDTLVDVPPAQWTTPDPAEWRPGQTLRIPLSPPAAPGERVGLRILLREENAVLATLSMSAGDAGAPLAAATLRAELTPSSLVADGAAASRLAVVVSHPAGAGAIARVTADLFSLGNGSRSANTTLELNDAGLAGDVAGGDGVWSGLVRPPGTTAPGLHTIVVNATSLSGARAGTATAVLNVTGNASSLWGGGGGNGTGGSGGGNVTGGTCYGCVVTGGVSSYEGTRLEAPNSKNVSQFRLRNWTWDKLTPANIRDDALVIRVVNSSAPWSMYFRFDHLDNKPCMTYARAWTGLNETIYAPYNGTCLSLEKLDLDLLDPVATQQLKWVSGVPNTHALYPAANLTGRTTFILAYLRDEDPTGQDELSQEIGVFSMDVVMS